MSEVFGKSAVTSREFPAIVFDAAGTLLHFMPNLHRFYEQELKALNIPRSLEEIERAFVFASAEIMHQAEADSLFESTIQIRSKLILQKLKVSEAQIDEALILEALQFLHDRFPSAVKVVIADNTVRVLEALKDRGYQIAVASNWNVGLGPLLKVQGILDLFDVVLTSEEVGHSKPQFRFAG